MEAERLTLAHTRATAQRQNQMFSDKATHPILQPSIDPQGPCGLQVLRQEG